MEFPWNETPVGVPWPITWNLLDVNTSLDWNCLSFTKKIDQAMSTLHRKACVPTQKPYRIGLLFTKGSLISALFLQRSDAAPLRFWKWIVTYRTGSVVPLLASCEQVPDHSGSQWLGEKIGFHNMAAFPLVLTSGYLERCTQFTALYHEFNCFESP